MSELKTLKDTAIAAAHEAGRLIRDRYGRAHDLTYKQEDNLKDFATEADQMAEAAIIGIIRERHPDHRLLAEESGAHGRESTESTETDGESAPPTSSSPYRWIIDPVDGTVNFAHGIPHFATSIAVEVDGELAVGVINDPAKQELFTAVRGEGAQLNGESIQVSDTARMGGAVVGSGFPYDHREVSDNNLDHWDHFARAARGMRRMGAAALDLAYTAAGRFDVYWEINLKPWDMAAGALMVREAGGTATDLQGSRYTIDHPNILATNGRLLDRAVDILTQGDSGL